MPRVVRSGADQKPFASEDEDNSAEFFLKIFVLNYNSNASPHLTNKDFIMGTFFSQIHVVVCVNYLIFFVNTSIQLLPFSIRFTGILT